MVKRSHYHLLVCDYEAGASTALQTIRELRKTAARLPVIFLSDHVSRVSVEKAINESARKDPENEGPESQRIVEAVDAYCNERQLQKAEDMLRKLGRAVEQSADSYAFLMSQLGMTPVANPPDGGAAPATVTAK